MKKKNKCETQTTADVSGCVSAVSVRVGSIAFGRVRFNLVFLVVAVALVSADVEDLGDIVLGVVGLEGSVLGLEGSVLGANEHWNSN